MLAVDGSHSLWYDEHGSGPPLLVIPGLGASRLSWASQIARLSPHFRLLVIVIHGDLEPLLPYANGQHLASHIYGSVFHTYHGVGHLPPIEASDRLGRDVLDFFRAEL